MSSRGRRFCALKLWFVIRHYVRRHVELAETFARRVGASAEFGLAAPAPLNLVCFRHKAGDEFNRHLLDRLNRSGTLYLTHTMLQGRHTLRLYVAQTWDGSAARRSSVAADSGGGGRVGCKNPTMTLHGFRAAVGGFPRGTLPGRVT